MTILLLLACDPGSVATPSTGTAGSGPTGDPATVELAGTCPMDVDYGGFAVEAYDTYSLVSGSVLDGVVPTTVLTELLTEGGCSLLRRENPFCDPACDPGETCDLDGTCVPYPEAADLGTVTVRGLLAEVVMEPVVPGYTYFATDLPHPAWEDGALIQLDTSGGDFEPVRLHGVGFPLLEMPATTWTVEEGHPLSLSWTAAPEGSRSEITFELNVDQHGITPVTLSCVFPDTGAAEIPADLVDELLAQGISGYPSATLARRTADRADLGDGCIDLQVRSPRSASVEVAGVTPCNEDRDCPPGQSCDLEMQICT